MVRQPFRKEGQKQAQSTYTWHEHVATMEYMIPSGRIQIWYQILCCEQRTEPGSCSLSRHTEPPRNLSGKSPTKA